MVMAVTSLRISVMEVRRILAKQSAGESNRAFLESHNLVQGYKQYILRERQGSTWCSSTHEGYRVALTAIYHYGKG